MKAAAKISWKLVRRHFWMLIMLAYLVLAFLPGRFWYDPGQMEILDAAPGEPVQILYQGGARREFLGRYTVTMRRFETQEIVCEASSGFFPYRTDSQRPDPLYMDWWAPADPRCNNPPTGHFQTTTCWTVSGILWGLVPPKHVCTDPIGHSVRPVSGG